MHFEVLSYHGARLLDQASFAVNVHAWNRLLDFVAVEEVALHSCDAFFLGSFEFSEGFVNVVFDPAQVLLSWISKREDVRVVCQNIVLEIFKARGSAVLDSILVKLIIEHFFFKIERISSS